jgi:2-oxoglutarate dehydrogenase E1 component
MFLGRGLLIMSENVIYQNILENIKDGVFSLDLHGRLITFNPAAESILNLSRPSVIGRTFVEVFLSIEGSDDFCQVVLDAISDSSTVHHQRVNFPVGGIRKVLSVTTSLLFDNKNASGRGGRAGVIAVFRDITEVEQLRDSVRAMGALRVEQLVRAYRERGHVIADLDPLALKRSRRYEELDPAHYGIRESELNEYFTILWGRESVTWPLEKILDELRRVYCGAVAIQYLHIDDLKIQEWLRQRIEGREFSRPPSREEQLRILSKLIDAEVFETFIHAKFSRTKRFSLEGAETLIPLLDQAIENAAEHGVEGVIIGMAHRGRLNVLANILEMPAHEIFCRFEQLDTGEDSGHDGDVQFHLGVETVRETLRGKSMRLSLCFNSSHLEFVGPVVLGRTRARQDRCQAEAKGNILPLIIHGDAAFAGEGIVQEQFNLSRLKGYTTGGAVHVILNNQIGFTTDPVDGRSTQYSSDVARMLQIPIFHVNGENPEAVCRVIRLAMDFWKTWRLDVVVDMYCYRRQGHMELDDPCFTQPLLYQKISEQPPIRKSYTENMIRLGQVSLEDAEQIAGQSQQKLADELHRVAMSNPIDEDQRPGQNNESLHNLTTFVSHDTLVELLRKLSELPSGFTAHSKIRAMVRRRKAMAEGRQKLDWATGETLAYATLLSSGYSVRLTGQDSTRGAFAHRHAVLHDLNTGSQHVPLNNLIGHGSGRFSIYNSPLTESATLAFEFGYSIEADKDLVIWEAQFGDFANVAQAVIDQFIVSSEAKWQQASGLVLFLPHGLEGQGPEHSSARLERFLQLCACNNIHVVQLTTASQIFHRLRRQGMSTIRKPLIVLTPKKMLQHPGASSSLEEMCNGHFHEVIAGPSVPDIQQILLCSGQVAVELEAERTKRQAPAVIVRLEQLYPFPRKLLEEVLSVYPQEASLIWVQEEPENMGAWYWLRPYFEATCDRTVRCVARPERVSPATGSLAIHNHEQKELLDRAFLPDSPLSPDTA